MEKLSLKAFIQVANSKVAQGGDELKAQAAMGNWKGTADELVEVLVRYRPLFDENFDSLLPGLKNHLCDISSDKLMVMTELIAKRLDFLGKEADEAAPAPSETPGKVTAGVPLPQAQPAADAEDFSAILQQKSIDEMNEDERAAINMSGVESESGIEAVLGKETTESALQENILDELISEGQAKFQPEEKVEKQSVSEDDLLDILNQKSVDEMSEEERLQQDISSKNQIEKQHVGEDGSSGDLKGECEENDILSIKQEAGEMAADKTDIGVGEGGGAADLDEVLKNAGEKAISSEQQTEIKGDFVVPDASAVGRSGLDVLEELLNSEENGGGKAAEDSTLEDLLNQGGSSESSEGAEEAGLEPDADDTVRSAEEEKLELALDGVEDMETSVTHMIDTLADGAKSASKAPAESAEADEEQDALTELLSQATGRRISEKDLEAGEGDSGVVALNDLIRDAEETLNQSRSRVISEHYRLEQGTSLLYEGPDLEELRKAAEEKVLQGSGKSIRLLKVITREVLSTETITREIPFRIRLEIKE